MLSMVMSRNFVYQSTLLNGIYKQSRPRSDFSSGSSLIRIYTAIPLSIFWNNFIKKQNI